MNKQVRVKIVADYFAINIKGKEFAKGDEVEIDDNLAKQLIALGKVAEIKEASKPNKNKEEDK